MRQLQKPTVGLYGGPTVLAAPNQPTLLTEADARFYSFSVEKQEKKGMRGRKNIEGRIEKKTGPHRQPASASAVARGMVMKGLSGRRRDDWRLGRYWEHPCRADTACDSRQDV